MTTANPAPDASQPPTNPSAGPVPPVRIVIIDDHPMVRAGIVAQLSSVPHYTVCGEADSVATALRLVSVDQPDLAIIDLELQSANGLELAKALRNAAPSLKILMLSGHDEEIYARRALKAGISGYLMKGADSETFLRAVATVLKGHIYLSEVMYGTMMQQILESRTETQRSPLDRLSDRELEILALIGRGCQNLEIARKLGISARTIESHREGIKFKLDLPDAEALLRFAVQFGDRL